MAEREQFENLRDAFCAHYRCKPEAYVRKVFGKSLSLRSKLLVMLVGGSGDPRFAHDLEVIQSLAMCTGYDELNHSLDELVGMQHMDRSRLRQWLGVRADAGRLRMLLEPLIGNVRRRPREELPASSLRIEPDSGSMSAIPSRSVESGTQRMRQIMRIHAAIVVGVPPEDAMAKEMLRFADLEMFLTEFARLRPEMAWLLSYLREREELKRLRERLRDRGSFETV
jgi:hypothetical protein